MKKLLAPLLAVMAMSCAPDRVPYNNSMAALAQKELIDIRNNIRGIPYCEDLAEQIETQVMRYDPTLVGDHIVLGDGVTEAYLEEVSEDGRMKVKVVFQKYDKGKMIYDLEISTSCDDGVAPDAIFETP